jgi:retron-type reverse transcriptase
MKIIEQVASDQNLLSALHHCRRGKKTSQGYQKFILGMPETLLKMQQDLLSGTYQWLPYRSLEVCDPKRREILAAPFRDRIVHQAIHQVIGAKIEASIPLNSFACRADMGNRRAAVALFEALKVIGPQRYAVKLDVRKFFFSIDHKILLDAVKEKLWDDSLDGIILSLIKSHSPFAATGKGIPIGNVTSQSFANLYLAPIDRMALGQSEVFYVRYMDDMVLCGRHKADVCALSQLIKEFVRDHLLLEISFQKTVPLGHDPIPFLGYVLDHQSFRPLGRNLRRHRRNIKSLKVKGYRPSAVAQRECSFAAWSKLC